MPPPQICVIGSLNIDFVTYTPRCPAAGETLTAAALAISAGGKGANQAVACGRASFAAPDSQDASVAMIGAVGADDPYYAALLRPTLEGSGVSTRGVQERTDSQTGSATIIVEEAARGENRILVVPGANHTGMDQVDAVLARTQGLLHSHLEGVVLLQGEIPRATTLRLMKHFNDPACRAHLVFNPAPVFPEGIPLPALAGTSVLAMNETEAVLMTHSVADHLRPGQNAAELDPDELAPLFHHHAQVHIVLITLGAKGAYFSTATGKRGFAPSAAVEKVVDTTAAGDTFVGYFATAFARFVATGAPLPEFDAHIESAVRRANLAAAGCVQRKGAMQSIPFAYEI
ncbi:Ribokinase-like protein [Aspergillus heteromorphus CBS 117.55]|uniref:Ribokinase n=1 Tax=Aspergillus heteromorphus CBS 117.55 TaxID=1448321 RepID=A0A317V122_9EURO|nr:Ribokinase-like protein [Aspergillus heteromorphus CBS 117.55]PWY66778.1 Ribokinase-like protein [Aspergillus heteromorphus CBS 117.55]